MKNDYKAENQVDCIKKYLDNSIQICYNANEIEK